MRQILLQPQEHIEDVLAFGVKTLAYAAGGTRYHFDDYVAPDASHGAYVYLGNRLPFSYDEVGFIEVDPRPFIVFMDTIYSCFVEHGQQGFGSMPRLEKFLFELNCVYGPFMSQTDFTTELNLARDRYEKTVTGPVWKDSIWGESRFVWHQAKIIRVENEKISLSFEYGDECIVMAWKYLCCAYTESFWCLRLPWGMHDENKRLIVL